MNTTGRIALALGMGAAALTGAQGVTVTGLDAKGDKGMAFVAKDLRTILRDVPGTVAFRTDPAMERQRWRLKSDAGGNLEIIARDGIGFAHGAYEFLERYAKCAWYAGDTSVIPDLKGWTIPSNLDETHKPPFAYYYASSGGTEAINPAFRLRNKAARKTFGTVEIRIGSPKDTHTFVFYADALRKAHPECFGNRVNAKGGVCRTLCMTDETTRDFVAEEMCRYIAKDRAPGGKCDHAYNRPVWYELSQDDGPSANECMCPRCKALFEAEGSYAGPNLAFVNAVAERVEKRYPDVIIQTFAYAYTQKPPKTVKARHNVAVRYCGTGVFGPLTAETPNGREIMEWGRRAEQLSIWSYWRTYDGNLFPFLLSPERIAAELRFARANKVTRYYAENEEPLGRSLWELQHWLFLKLAVDPDRDPRALARRFFAAYYGAAAKTVEEYADFLYGAQEKTRTYMTRAFYERANALLDRAERETAGDAKANLHVRRERIVVDRSMFDRLSALIEEGYSVDSKAVAARLRRNVTDAVRAWWYFEGGTKGGARERYLANAESEEKLFSRYPVPIPERFRHPGVTVEDLQWNRCSHRLKHNVFVDDPDACAGTAFYRDDIELGLPFSFGWYDHLDRRGEELPFVTQADVPQDEKFHLYKIGRTKIKPGLVLRFDNSWRQFYTSPIGIVWEDHDIWISAKFQGPNFVAGSTKPNRVLIDRVLYVKGDDPLREFLPPDPAKALLKCPFDEGLAGWERRADADPNGAVHLADDASSGKCLTVEGRGNGWRYAKRKFGTVADLKGGILVRGRFKYAGVDPVNGHDLPFLGIAAKSRDGKRSIRIPCAAFFSGDYDWQPFEAVITADRLRRNAALFPAEDQPVALAFQLGIYHQPGSVWVDDLEIISLENRPLWQTK